MTYEEKVKVVVKEQYEKLGLAEEDLCNDDKAVMLSQRCEEILQGGNLYAQTQEEWDILEAEVNKWLPPGQ